MVIKRENALVPDISINSNSQNICDVDHFLPHTNKVIHSQNGANINGVWNLVLADIV